jgi:IMP dehydrogenase/GMP reductase
MIRINLAELVCVYLLVFLAAILAVWIAYEMVRRAREIRSRRYRTRCAVCGMEFEDRTPAILPRCTNMGMWIGRNRKARVTYGFDEIALVPGDVTINPNEVDISFRLPRRDAEPIKLSIPILASAMDGVVDVRMAIAMGKLGGLGVLNLEGVQTRYENPSEVLAEVVSADKENVTALIQKLYLAPVREELIARRVEEIKKAGVISAVSSIPQKAEEAPGRGTHWGMATPHANLPRGTRIKVGVTGSLKQILFGPAEVDDGSQNLVGAITTCMGSVGAASIREFQETEIIIAPSIKTEGKLFQVVQNVGMGTK